MKIEGIHLKDFKRFKQLTISNLPESAKLVMLIGPNGCGKSSLFDAMNLKLRSIRYSTPEGFLPYYRRSHEVNIRSLVDTISISFHDNKQLGKSSIYIRSAHRNDPAFAFSSLSKSGSMLDERRLGRLIDDDKTTSSNYQRLVSQALQDAFETLPETTSLRDFRDKAIADVREAILELFPNLKLNSLGDPLASDSTFRFSKGEVDAFKYENLSGGEKAAFDLVLDLVVKRREFNDTVFCIDEPESHVSMRLQSKLLSVLYKLIPDNCQLWIATHSIGMMREAFGLQKKGGSKVVFLDFDQRDFDKEQEMRPAVITRSSWEKIHEVLLGDLAGLVAPDTIYLCESAKGFDADCYNRIFNEAHPQVKFISVGSKSDVLRIAPLLKKAMPTMRIHPLRDRDNMTDEQLTGECEKGVRILSRRCLECYLLDRETMEACFHKHELDISQLDKAMGLIDQKSEKPKEALAEARTFLIKLCPGLPIGDNREAFGKHLAGLITSKMEIYKSLKRDIFDDSNLPPV